MTLTELKRQVDSVVERAKECDRDPDDIPVSLQINIGSKEIWSYDEVEVHWDNDHMASGCVITAFKEE